MTLSITHAKVSAIADDSVAAAAGEVLPSDWNGAHTVTGSQSITSQFAPYQSNPILSPTGNENLTAFGSVLMVGSTYYYYYTYSPDGTAGHAIGRATSSDGKTWTKDSAHNPVFTKAVSGWDAGTVAVPNVWKEGSTWQMLYRGGAGTNGPFRGGRATSSDGITWTRVASTVGGVTGNGCVLDLGYVSGGTEDIEFFGVIKVGSTYYAGIDNPGGATRGAGIATSTDLSNWTKDSQNPLYTGGRYCTNIIKLGDYYYQFVNHYIDGAGLGGATTFANVELYRNSTPVFYTATREYLGFVLMQSGTNLATDGTNWDAYALDTPWILTDDITRSTFAASSGDLWCYYAGSPTAAHTNYYTGLAISAPLTSFNRQDYGFFTKAITTPGQLTVGGGATIFGNAVISSNLTAAGMHATGNLVVDGSTSLIGAGLQVTNTAMTMTSGSLVLSGTISGTGIFGTSGVKYKNPATTLTDTTASGTIAAHYSSVWAAMTLAAANAVTITNAYGAYFADPAAGSNVTLTNKYALGADSLYVGISCLIGGATGTNSTTSLAVKNTSALSILEVDTTNRRFYAGGGAGSSSFCVLVASGLSQTYDAGGFAFSSNGSAEGTPDLLLRKGTPKVFSVEAASGAGGTVRFVATTPSQITGNQDNYNPGGTSYFQRWNTDASHNITGLTFAATQVDGQTHVVVNVGAQNIVLQHNTTSTAANRFQNTSGADITLSAGQQAMLIYDATSGGNFPAWRVSKMN